MGILDVPSYSQTQSDGRYATKNEAGLLFTPANSRFFRKAKAQVRAGTADGKILCIGDSTTGGIGVNELGQQGLPGSYPYKLAEILNGQGLPARPGFANAGPNSGNFDSRFTFGTGWNYTTGFGFASRAIRWAPSTTGTLTFQDYWAHDTYDIYYVVASTGSASGGTFTAQATGGTLVNVTTTATSGYAKVTVSAGAELATNVVTITASGSVQVIISGIEGYTAGSRKMRLGNAGYGGTEAAANWGLSGTWTSDAMIKAYAPDLTLISLGINDAGNSVAVATYLAAITKLTTAAQVSGDVVIMPPFPPGTTATTNMKNFVNLYTDALPSLALPIADVRYRWISGADVEALGFKRDALHPNALGYGDIAEFLAPKLLTA